MKTEIGSNDLRLLIEKSLYSEEVLYKCFYWYGADFTVEITPLTPEFFEVTLSRKNLMADLEVTAEKIKRDLIDFKLRHIITTETQTIRELLVAKAFANFDINDDPATLVSDPVGFDPNH